MSASLRSAIARDRRHLVDLAAELIRIPTVNPPGSHYAACVATLDTLSRRAGLATRVVRIPHARVVKSLPDAVDCPRAIVIGRWDVGAPRTVHFNAHYDVVPAAPTGWRFGPFEPRVSGGWLYGRGSADMKGSIACVLHALATMRRLDITPSVNIEVSWTPDEETDSTFGVQWLVQKKLLEADYAIVCEGGSGRHVGCGHNGVLWFEVDVHGRAAHGSEPHRGLNAVEQMSALVLELKKYQQQLARRTFRNPDGRIRSATLNVGGVTATQPGGKINTVPGAVTLTLDRRVLPNENLTEAERHLRAFIRGAARRIPRLRVTVRKINQHTATFSDPEGPFPRAFGAALSRVRGQSARFTVSTGFNDSHFFAGEGGLPTIGWGPGGEACHGTDERVRVAELVEAAQTYAEFVTTFAG
ncbi:MAG: M20 family metallopeptidase [Opitutaceae bacterium]|nr:M20 family metallopeptidase [Opitutaceae bacterium]